jgi:hypothetical protein
MKPWLFLFLVISLAACSTQSQAEQPRAEEMSDEMSVETPVGKLSDLPDLGEAPELGNEVWLNTDGSLRLADLRGQVVLLDMWTFG